MKADVSTGEGGKDKMDRREGETKEKNAKKEMISAENDETMI